MVLLQDSSSNHLILLVRRLGETVVYNATAGYLNHSSTQQGGGLSNATLSDSHNVTAGVTIHHGQQQAQAQDGTSEMDGLVFWCVNAFILFLIVSICSWLWCFAGGIDALVQNQQESSDVIYARTVEERRQRQLEAKRDTPDRRKRKLLKCFQRNQVKMIVKSDDLIEASESNDCVVSSRHVSDLDNLVSEAVPEPASIGNDNAEEEDGSDVDVTSSPVETIITTMGIGDVGAGEVDLEAGGRGYLILRNPNSGATMSPNLSVGSSTTALSSESLSDSVQGITTTTASHPRAAMCGRKVPNCCAICLGAYETGESVVWSSNSDCPHAFHEECMLDWLLHNLDDSRTPCPLCRNDFTDLEQYRREQRILCAGKTFDPSVLRWR